MKLSFYFPYYNQPSTLRERLLLYSNMDPEILSLVEFIVVDDGSMEHPIEDVLKDFEIKKGFNLIVLRINIDIPWNQPEANNFGIFHANNDFIFRTDIDHFLPESELKNLLQELPNLPKNTVFFPTNRFSLSENNTINQHVNTFIIRKTEYFKVNGFNEFFSKSYGSDDRDFYSRLKTMFQIQSLDNVTPHVNKNDSTQSLSRDDTQGKSKLNQHDRPHLMFQHAEHYQFIYPKKKIHQSFFS